MYYLIAPSSLFLCISEKTPLNLASIPHPFVPLFCHITKRMENAAGMEEILYNYPIPIIFQRSLWRHYVAYIVNNQPVGPVAEAEIQKLISAGKIHRGQMVWTQGMPGWQPIERTPLSALLGAVQPVPPAPYSAPAAPLAPATPATPGAPYAPGAPYSPGSPYQSRPGASNKYNITFLQAPTYWGRSCAHPTSTASSTRSSAREKPWVYKQPRRQP